MAVPLNLQNTKSTILFLFIIAAVDEFCETEDVVAEAGVVVLRVGKKNEVALSLTCNLNLSMF